MWRGFRNIEISLNVRRDLQRAKNSRLYSLIRKRCYNAVDEYRERAETQYRYSEEIV